MNTTRGAGRENQWESLGGERAGLTLEGGAGSAKERSPWEEMVGVSMCRQRGYREVVGSWKW